MRRESDFRGKTCGERMKKEDCKDCICYRVFIDPDGKAFEYCDPSIMSNHFHMLISNVDSEDCEARKKDKYSYNNLIMEKMKESFSSIESLLEYEIKKVDVKNYEESPLCGDIDVGVENAKILRLEHKRFCDKILKIMRPWKE